jgi:hypothetical protein
LRVGSGTRHRRLERFGSSDEERCQVGVISQVLVQSLGSAEIAVALQSPCNHRGGFERGDQADAVAVRNALNGQAGDAGVFREQCILATIEGTAVDYLIIEDSIAHHQADGASNSAAVDETPQDAVAHLVVAAGGGTAVFYTAGDEAVLHDKQRTRAETTARTGHVPKLSSWPMMVLL